MIRFYAFLSRMKYIRRWSLMRSGVEENIMEHSWQTAVFAHALALVKNEFFGGTVDPERTALLALFHETGEVVTGDLPTPVKYNNPEIRRAYGDLERKAEKKLLGLLPEELRGRYEGAVTADRGSEEYRIVKEADKLAAYVKCIEELSCGNGEFRKAKEAIGRDLAAMDSPEVDYFLRECVPAFALTLDELDAEEER